MTILALALCALIAALMIFLMFTAIPKVHGAIVNFYPRPRFCLVAKGNVDILDMRAAVSLKLRESVHKDMANRIASSINIVTAYMVVSGSNENGQPVYTVLNQYFPGSHLFTMATFSNLISGQVVVERGRSCVDAGCV